MTHEKAAIFAIFITSGLFAAQQQRQLLTVANMIESPRIVTDYERPLLWSPDGRRYAIVLQRGDLKRNGSWIEFFVGGNSSFRVAKPFRVARLFTTSTAEGHHLAKDIRWVGNDKLAFLWDDGKGSPHIETVDVRTHRLRALTSNRTGIVEYSSNSDGRVFVFTVRKTDSTRALAKLLPKGFAVGDQSVWDLIGGAEKNQKGTPGWYETFVISNNSRHMRKIDEPRLAWATAPQPARLSPDGRYAIVERPAQKVSEDWQSYTDHSFKEVLLPGARRRPNGPNLVREYEIIDTERAIARPLWGAPVQVLGSVVWSPDSEYVAIGPTFVPPKQAAPEGLAGKAVVVISIRDGKFVQLPVPKNNLQFGYGPVEWSSDGLLTMSDVFADPLDPGKAADLSFKRVGGEWRQVDASSGHKPSAQVEIQVRQDPNTPPSVFGVNPATHEERLLFEVNPELRKFELGHVEKFHWAAKDGKPWTGMLYYPVHYQPGRRYPLVIQTHGYTIRFSLDGGFSTAFAAQPLAAAGIAVLQTGGPDDGEFYVATPREPEAAMAAVEGAIDTLVERGIVSRNKVGIVGFSRTGWHVAYILTHSPFAFAAAIIADNMNASYLQYVLNNTNFRTELDKDVGAAPFGKGLETWIHSAPGFGADKIRCPLRQEFDSGPLSGIINHWELFSQLRHLGKPVELFVIPDIQHGSHILQNPAQRLASQGGTVDWFRFWLNGEEDTDPHKTAQYARWRELRKQSGQEISGQ